MKDRCSTFGQVAFLLLIATLPASTYAIDIVINPKNKNMNPSYDPNGDQLTNLFNAAATLWEDYLPGSGTVPLDVWWDSTLSPGTGGIWETDLNPFTNDTIKINVAPSVAWYLDPSPSDNGEFDFVTKRRPVDPYLGGQWLYRDLDQADQSNWLSGNPPGALEIGYLGWETSSEGPVHEKIDLLSVILHEVGHALGLHTGTSPWSANSNWVNNVSGIGFAEDANHVGHLAADISALYYSGRHSSRVLPSAMDIMAVASSRGMTMIDLPRKDFWGGTSWETPLNWEGGAVPDADDDAYVRHGGYVGLSDAHVENLVVDEGTEIGMPGWAHALTVDNTLTVGKGPSSSANLVWVVGGALSTYKAVIGDAAGSVGRVQIEYKTTWTNTTDVYVGNSGHGTLTVHGGRFSASNLYLGYGPSGIGSLDMPANFPSIEISGSIYVGGQGEAVVTQTNGTVNVPRGAIVISNVNAPSYYVANGGSINALHIYNYGGVLTITNGASVSGAFDVLNGNTSVSGSGSTYSSFDLIIGQDSSGTLIINSGAHATSAYTTIGAGFHSMEITSTGTLMVDGIGSRFDSSTQIVVGSSGTFTPISFGHLTVANGAVVSTPRFSLGSGTGVGIVDIRNGGTLSATVIENHRGVISGNGLINGDLQNNSVVWSGDGNGSLNINGSYSQTSAGTLGIQLTSDSSYDRLLVTGSISFDGELDVSLNGSYVPSAGDIYDILSFSTHTGTFSTLSLPALPGALAWDSSQLYTTGVLRVILLGDYNSNGIVDTADYVVWRNDPNRTQSQYSVWRSHFGQSSGSGSAANTSNAVPETTTAVLMLVATCIGSTGRKTQRKCSSSRIGIQ